MARLKLASHLTFDVLDGQLLVCDPRAGVVHELSGSVATAVESLQGNPAAPIDDEVARQLVAAGIAVPLGNPNTRRHVLIGGAALATGGVVSMVLPTASAAASTPGGGLGDGDLDELGGGGGNGGAGGDGDVEDPEDPVDPDEGFGGSGGNGGGGTEAEVGDDFGGAGGNGGNGGNGGAGGGLAP